MTLAIERYTGPAAEWDSLVARSQGGTHAHRLAWIGVIEEVFGLETILLAARDRSGALAGVLPLVRQRSLLLGHYLTSMPFLNSGGPLGTPEAVRVLAEEAVRLGRASGVRLLELRSRADLGLALPVSRRKITVVLDLPHTAEALHRSFPAKLRSQIRRPQKDGVEVRTGGDDVLVADFHRVFAQHMRDLGTPALPRAFFDAVAQRFSGDAWFAVAYLRGRPIAGGAGVCWNGESEIVWASALRSHASLAANMLVYWKAMEHAIGAGCRWFNFGRCSPGSGSHRFKRQWGGRDVPLWWYQDSPVGVTATPSPGESKFRLGVAVWRHLPLRVAGALGRRLVRNIP
jgi:FemAB-related protein (PEP-CTERM system-associated)